VKPPDWIIVLAPDSSPDIRFYPGLPAAMRIKILSLLFLCFAVPTALFAQAIPTPAMAMSWNMKKDSRKWAAQNLKGSPSGFLLQLVPSGDSLASWKEMVVQQIIFTSAALPVFVDSWKTDLLKADPKTELKETTNPDGSVWVTSTSSAKDTICLRRFLRGFDGVYMLAYFVRPNLRSDATFKVWSGIIAAAILVPNPEKKGNPPLAAKLVGRISLADSTLHFNEVDFLPRWAQADSHEYTPTGQEDLDHWSDMITINYYRKVTDREGLASAANAVLQNYKNSHGRILGVHSVPRTPDKPAEHFIAVVFVGPGIVEAAFARFKLVGGVGASLVYSHRYYGDRAFGQMRDWLKSNGRATEDALMGWSQVPAPQSLPLLGLDR